MFLYEKMSEKYIKLGIFVSFNVRYTFWVRQKAEKSAMSKTSIENG